MDKKRAYIWDLDGTLLDSYEVIISSLYETYKEFGVELDRELCHEHAIKFSVKSLIQELEEKRGIPYDAIKARYSEISDMKMLEIKAIKDGKKVLEALEKSGADNYVFTHRGRSTEPVLKNLGMFDCFREILTSKSGFPRKPEPDALIYLINKYNLDKENTFYVGDRIIDMECAKAAGIKGILYMPEGSPCESNGAETYIVRELMEICDIEK